MPDPKNTPFGNTSKIESETNKENIFPHTMQDDLDDLSGKITEEKEVGSNNVQNNIDKSESESETKNVTDNPFISSPSRQTQADTSPKDEDQKKAQYFEIDRKIKNEKEKTLPEASSNKSLKWNKILILTLSVVVILVLAAGGYYFWTTRSSINPVVQPQPLEPSEEPVINVPSERFSVENPNYLNIEVENVAADDIIQLLTQTILEVRESKIKVPIEFLIADDNNNPIAFSRFAYLFQLNLSSETLSSLEENFSLYLYNDNGNIRLGMAIDFKDKEKIEVGMAEEEKVLVENLFNLLLGASIEKEDSPFNNGEYKNYSIRYVNLDKQETFSIDYAFTGKQLVIGTSKNTIRAILDKIENDGGLEDNIDSDAVINDKELEDTNNTEVEVSK